MIEFVSGWHDEKDVYLLERIGEQLKARRVAAKWSAFFLGFDDDDRAAAGRAKEVIGVTIDRGYTRIDFANRWARKDFCFRIGELVKARQYSGADDTPCGVYEGDVNPLRRLLSDSPHLQIASSFRLGYFDLETDSRVSFDDARAGKARVLCWCLSNADRTVIEDATLEADTDEAERALLVKFFEAAAKYDVMLAWNGDCFDFPVLESRAVRIRLRMPNGKPVFWHRWCWLDAMNCFKKYNQAHDSGEERASFSLNSIANHLLGEGKDTFDASKTWQSWAAGGEERERLARYNVRDTELMPRIEDETGFIALHLAVCQATRCFPDSNSLGAAQQGDGFLLRLGAEQGYRFATKREWGDEDSSGDRFLGAYVMAPKRLGLIENVHVCDFAGLYPSIMRSWNMSPDTYVPPFHVTRADAPPTCKLPDRNAHFRTDVRGIFPLALDKLVAQRAEYTKRADDAEPGSDEWHRYKRLSSAFKIIANSFYGIVGSPFTRYFDKTIAEGVTQTGAWLIKHVARTSEHAGLEAFYGDTDSIFVQGNAETFGKVVTSLNGTWPGVLKDMGCTESRIKLEFEKSYSKLVLVSAKRYAAKYSMYKGKPAPADMKPEVKGLEYKRGDALRLAREMQAEIIDLLLRPVSADVAEMRAFVERWRSRVLEQPLSIEDVLLSQSVKNLNEYALRYTTSRCAHKVGVGKNAVACKHEFYETSVKVGPKACPKCKTERKVASQPAHVRVAWILKERGVEIMAGTRIPYLVVHPAEGEVSDGKLLAVPAYDPGMLERIDRSYYWEDRVLAPTKRVLEVVYANETWDEKKLMKELDVARVATKAARVRKRDEHTLNLFQSGGGDSHAAETEETLER